MKKEFTNDVKVLINRVDNGEKLIDGEYVTSFIINVDKNGDMTSSYFGLCNKDFISAIESVSKNYFKKMKKEFKKNKLLEEAEVEVKDSELPEKHKLKNKEELKEKVNKRENKIQLKDINEDIKNIDIKSKK